MSEQGKQDEILEMLGQVVERYRDHPALSMWQLENEPLFDFGECPPQDQGFLEREEALVRSLDPHHGILITDSGELSSWLGAGRYGDLLGTTMYRTVFSRRTNSQFHYDYIFPAWLYRLKAGYVGLLRDKNIIISELQGEPWGSAPYHRLTQEERYRSFSPARFREIQQFARRTAFPQAFWWGAEYWYWEKEVQRNPEFWDVAREFF